jgi:type IV pilus assembly protein PilM
MVATTFQMPRTMQASILTSIQFEARKHVPFDLEQSIVECQVLDPHDRQNEQMTVLLVAVRREAVDSRVRVLQESGLDPVWVDVKQFATLRACLYGHQDSAIFQETVALLRIGASFTEITMVRKGAFVFARIVPIAGSNMDRALASALSVDVEEARRLKEEMAVAGVRDQLVFLPEEQRQVSQVIAPVLEEIVRDLQRSFNFLASRLNLDPSAPIVDRVILTGGGARMRGIDSFMTAQLGPRVEVFNCFRSLPVSAPNYDAAYLGSVGPSIVAAVGLAVAEMMQRGCFPLSGKPESDALLVESGVAAG